MSDLDPNRDRVAPNWTAINTRYGEIRIGHGIEPKSLDGLIVTPDASLVLEYLSHSALRNVTWRRDEMPYTDKSGTISLLISRHAPSLQIFEWKDSRRVEMSYARRSHAALIEAATLGNSQTTMTLLYSDYANREVTGDKIPANPVDVARAFLGALEDYLVATITPPASRLVLSVVCKLPESVSHLCTEASNFFKDPPPWDIELPLTGPDI